MCIRDSISTSPFLTALPLDTFTARMLPGMGAQTLSLIHILRAVVEADHRRAADGVADEDGYEDELDVHQNAVGGDLSLIHI